MQEFRPGETQYHDDAASRIESITKPALHAHVSHVFLPGSEIDLHLSWRNVDEIELALHPVDLVADLSYGNVKRRGNGPGSWADQLQIRDDAVRTWTVDAENKGNLSSALRIFVLETYRNDSAD